MASRRFALLAICASLAANTNARADGTFTITLLETTETTERVSVTAGSETLDCVAEGIGSCFNFTTVPCPVFQPPCDSPYSSGWRSTISGVELTLQRGQTYTFEGNLRTDVGLPDQTPCQLTCSNGETITTRIYETAPLPAVIPEWNVSVVSTDNDIVWVDIGMVNTSAQNRCTQGGYCKVVQTVFCEVRPCPPIVPPTCFGSYTLVVGSKDDVFRFGLAAGTTYTISGSFGTRGYDRDEEGGCQYVSCWTDEYPLVKTYKASTVAVTPTTWGAVKALYRAP